MDVGWRRFKTYWKQLPIEGRGSIAIAIPLVCLIGAVIADTILRQKMVAAQLYVNHTNQVLVKSQSTLISLLNAETGVRGYYIGKQKVFLTPYNLALTTLEPTLTNLQQLVQDNPAQLQQVKLLTQMARDRMSLLQESVQRVATKVASNPAVTNERLLTGKRSMDQFRDIIEQFETEEQRLLAIHTRSLQDQQSLNAYGMWCGIVIGIGGTAVAVRLLRQLATELQEREVRLRESRNLIQAIVANVVDGVMIINPQGRIATFNNAAIQMFGYTPLEVIGWDWQKLLTPAADATQKLLFYVPDLLVAAMPAGQIWQAMGQRKNGEWFPIEISMNSIALDDDRIAIIRDITHRQQAAAKLQATAVQLTALNNSLIVTNQFLLQSNRELDQFAYITSHDLKAPLRAIASLSEWIEEDLGGGISTEIRSQMQLLRGRVYRMQALLNSLLEYSRSGRRQNPITTVDVNQLLTSIIQALAPPDTFTIDIASPMPIINTRRQPLQQVFTHLIDNAIRHHPTETGIVKISVIEQGSYYEFAITDNGEGIDPQFQAKIYTIFQTLKARDLQENVGAGLAIVKKIVIAEGGTIQLESATGRGATFRFTWLKQPIIKEDIITSYEQ
jgi:PAS domain S-box-containing protein